MACNIITANRLALLFALLLGLAGPALAAETSPLPGIAVLDMDKAMTNANPVQARRYEIQIELARQQAELAKANKALSELREQVKATSPSNAGYAALVEQYKVEEFRLKTRAEQINIAIEKFSVKKMKEAYAELKSQVAAFAAERKYVMVLSASSMGPMGDRARDVTVELAQQEVLYHDTRLDCTDDFLKWVNARVPAPPKVPGAGDAPGAGPATPPSDDGISITPEAGAGRNP